MILDDLLISIPAKLAEECNSYIDVDKGYEHSWKPRRDLTRRAPDMWCVVHSALIDALSEGAEYAKAEMKYHTDGDGFYDYRGTIDVNVLASKIAWHVGEKLRLESVKRAA